VRKMLSMRLTHNLGRCILDLMTDQNDRLERHDRSTCASIPNPDTSPTISVAVAAHLAGVARRTGYMAAERGEWPVIRTGRAVRVRTREFLEQCGLLETS